jgi:hypothetical protein
MSLHLQNDLSLTDISRAHLWVNRWDFGKEDQNSIFGR